MIVSASVPVKAQQVASGSSTTKGNFQTDADYYANSFTFPDAATCTTPAPGTVGTDDWIGPRIPAAAGFYPAGPFPIGTGYGRIDTSGASVFKTALGCNVAGGSAANLTHIFTRNFDSLQSYIVPPNSSQNAGDTIVLLDALAYRDNFGLSGNLLDQTTFKGLSNKNTQNPSVWSLGPGTSGPNKNDLIDVGVSIDLAINAPKYYPIYYSPLDFTTHGFITTLSTNGDSHIDAEIFKQDVSYNSNCHCLENLGPNYGHSAWQLGTPPFISPSISPAVVSYGDMLISTDYTSNGGTTNTVVRIWLNPFDLQVSTSTNVQTRLIAWNNINSQWKPFNFRLNAGNYKAWNIDNPSINNFGYFEIVPTNYSQPFVWARTNSLPGACPIPSSSNTLALPWGNLAGTGAICTDSTISFQTLELTIDDTRLGISGFSFGSILYKTRSSSSFLSELKDFAGPFLANSAPLRIAAQEDIGINQSLKVYPNPSTGNTVIEFIPSSDVNAIICAYDMNGLLVSKIFNEDVHAGKEYAINFDASAFVNGVYFVRLSAGNQVLVRKLVIMK